MSKFLCKLGFHTKVWFIIDKNGEDHYYECMKCGEKAHQFKGMRGLYQGVIDFRTKISEG